MLIISRVSGQLLFPQSILLFFLEKSSFGEEEGPTLPSQELNGHSVLAPFSGVPVWMQDSGSISCGSVLPVLRRLGGG